MCITNLKADVRGRFVNMLKSFRNPGNSARTQVLHRKLNGLAACAVICSFAQEVIAVGVPPEKVFEEEKVIALARAVADGKRTEVQAYLASGVQVKMVGKKGFTVTHFALYTKENGPAIL